MGRDEANDRTTRTSTFRLSVTLASAVMWTTRDCMRLIDNDCSASASVDNLLAPRVGNGNRASIERMFYSRLRASNSASMVITLADSAGNRVCICAWPDGSTKR